MKEKLVSVKNFIKSNSYKFFLVLFVGVSLYSGFLWGKFYTQKFEPKVINIESIKVRKSQINLALDENNHLIVIDKKSGNYTVYQDSIGISIFKLYAKNIWSEQK
jgi:hypothetical protein